MARTATLLRGHDRARKSHTDSRDVAGTARVYLLEELALTRDQVMAARGWDQRHRRYRRRAQA